MNPTSAAYPATLTIDPPEKVANWRPLVHWLLAIPHFIVAWVLMAVAGICSFVAWFAILFTGKMPEGMTGIISLGIRYQTRAMSYATFLYEDYPPFTFESVTADPGDFAPVRVDFTPQLEGRNRLTVFFRYFMVIPQAIALAVVGIVAYVCVIIGFFAVLFTGKWPEGMRKIVIGMMRWSTRLSAYMYLLTDEYPPFSMD